MRVFVLGGGGSALEFVHSLDLWPDSVVSCNGHGNLQPDFQVAVDRPFWQRHPPEPGALGVYVNVGHDNPRWPGVLNVPGVDLWRHEWPETLADGLFVGGNSGCAAVSFAYHLGATEIHLIGIDLDGPPGKPWQKWRDAFQFAADCLKERGVKIVSHGRWQPE